MRPALLFSVPTAKEEDSTLSALRPGLLLNVEEINHVALQQELGDRPTPRHGRST
jgi:hypothetical protein